MRFISKIITLNTFLFLAVLALFTGCKPLVILPSKKPAKNIELKDLTKAIAKNQLHYKKFRSRVKTTYNDGKRKQQIMVNMRIENTKSIWMSATMLVPIAKVLITPDKVSFYEKFQRTFFEGDISFLNKQFNTDFEFKDLQNLLMGLPLSDLKKGDWERISHPKYYLLVPKSKNFVFRPTYFFDPNTFILVEQRFLVPGSQQSLTVKYLNHQSLDGELIPGEVQISLFDGKDLKTVSLVYNRIEFPSRMSLPFDIPEGYKPIEL